MATESAPIVWADGRAFVVGMSAADDRFGRLIGSWIFRENDGVLGAIGFLAGLRRRSKFGGAWQVGLRELDVDEASMTVWRQEFTTQRIAQRAASEVFATVRAGRLLVGTLDIG
ncbi:MAG: hypothetical protein JWN95_4057 [Frankiales bacterium]|nr:hypothetical protein [Frankiales bacterium]